MLMKDDDPSFLQDSATDARPLQPINKRKVNLFRPRDQPAQK